MTESMINGIPVKFPFEPYDIQKSYMSKVIECLQNECNGVLESPTGTGKTLSLLCSSLAWLEVKKAQMQAEFQAKGFSKHMEETGALLNDLNNACGSNKNPRGAFVQFPQIIYASRTHSQISQAMNELKRTSYKYMKASVLGSREQMCIHPEIKALESNATKVQMCRAKVQSRSCFYHNRVERERDNEVFQKNSVIDIEDLVKFGDSQKFCPYYMSKELKQNADIVFMPYNYLLDPRARKALGVELANSVIILDEAHNVEKICEDAASMQIKSTDVTLCIDEVTGVMKAISDDNNQAAYSDSPPDFSGEELMLLKGIFLKFEIALDGIQIKNSEEGSTYDGTYIFTLFESAGITEKNQAMICNLLDRVCTFLATSTEGPYQRKGHGLQLFQDLLQIVYASTGETFKEKLQKCYKVHLQVENEDRKKGGKSNWLSKATASKTKTECRVLSYWCFSPGFGMNVLMGQGIKCIILTSGTLAPLNPLITELELDIQVRLENAHIVKGDQVCVKILSKGPDGTPLNSSFRTRNDPAYIKSLGMTICNLTRMIPGGLLIFFPSYPIMKTCQEKWQELGLWASICQHKNIYLEPRDKQSFVECMNGYYEAVSNPGSGAIFMGVCRGKVSEGLDFVDANGRAVIITGLPYPPLKDPRVILKKRYLDVCRAQNREYLSGDDWYSLEATKAVNQAIGRVIRHKNDYGAIILLDSRFNNPRIINQMSLWLRAYVKNVPNYREIVCELRDFFKNATVKFPLGERKPPEDLKLDFTQTSYFPVAKKMSRQDLSDAPNEVLIRKRQGDDGESQFKRMKFNFKSNIANNGGESSGMKPVPEKPSIGDIKEYLLLVQKQLSTNDYSVFISMVKNYTRDHDISQVLNTLKNIFDGKPNLYYLLTGLRNFLRMIHRSEYDEFIARYAM